MVDLSDPYPYVPVKHPYVGGTRWNFMRWADIADAKDPNRVYLRRLRIAQTPWFALYLHWIFMPDDDRDPHDHPFGFWSLIVRGGYTEKLWRVVPGFARSLTSRDEKWRRFSVHKMDQREAHMITRLTPGTVTLVWAGPKTEGGRWGFYPAADRFVPWQQYRESMVDEQS